MPGPAARFAPRSPEPVLRRPAIRLPEYLSEAAEFAEPIAVRLHGRTVDVEDLVVS